MRNVLLFLFVSVLFSCTKYSGECEEPLFVTNSGLAIDFKDSSGRYLYRQVAPIYSKDSLKVWEESTGTQLLVLATNNIIPNTGNLYWQLDFGPLYNSQTDEVSFEREICKNFILRYKADEFDTLRTCFKSVKTKRGSMFETLKVYYKGQLIGTETNDVGINVTVVKK